MTATKGIEIQTEPNDAPTDFYVFLSPTRLSPSALKYLINHLGDTSSMAPERCPFAQVRWNSIHEGYAWVSDPYAWAADAQSLYSCPASENWIEFISNEDRAAKLTIARMLKNWIDAGKKIVLKLQEGQPNHWLQNYTRVHDRLRDISYQAAAYLCHCINAADNRAVEQSYMDHGGPAWTTVETHWSWVTMGAMVTEPGCRYLAALCVDEARFPAKVLFHENPPESWTSWTADSRYLYISARQLAYNLVPALIEVELAPLNRAHADWQTKWKRIRSVVGERLGRLGRREMTWRSREVRNLLRASA